MSKYCVHCGYQMDDTAGFCMRCGKPALVTRNRQSETAKRKKGAFPTNKRITQLEQNAEKVTVWDMIKEKDRNLKNKKLSLIDDEGYARGPFCDIVSEIKEGDDWIRNIYENWKTHAEAAG